MRHTHSVAEFSYRGKVDSVYIECFCGKTACVGDWYEQPPKGWNRRQWPRLIISIRYYLASMEDSRLSRRHAALARKPRIRAAVATLQATWRDPTADSLKAHDALVAELRLHGVTKDWEVAQVKEASLRAAGLPLTLST